ncbi:hypothetical protein HPB49_010735 [Dermacentor silvarum]|uniref:Uncharacterized protein n=1 Tax=Dermacentor silvarum TaxID=543639 RepID=A0ACB8DYY3_DERSI|nr:hypothetical protein HPB49_010735 [Dermacentor silvarum]
MRPSRRRAEQPGGDRGCGISPVASHVAAPTGPIAPLHRAPGRSDVGPTQSRHDHGPQDLCAAAYQAQGDPPRGHRATGWQRFPCRVCCDDMACSDVFVSLRRDRAKTPLSETIDRL